jgi:hypothetical protein
LFFRPSHVELLPVRNAKKEQAAYEKQMKKETEWEQDREEELSAIAVTSERPMTTPCKPPAINRFAKYTMLYRAIP